METSNYCFLCNNKIIENSKDCIELYWHKAEVGETASLFLSLCRDCFEANKDKKQKYVNKLDTYCCYCNKEVLLFKENCMYFASKSAEENQMYPFMHRQCFEQNVALFPEGYKTQLEEQLEWSIVALKQIKANHGQPNTLIVSPQTEKEFWKYMKDDINR